MHDFITIDGGGGESVAMTFKYNEAVAAAAAAATTTSTAQSNYRQLNQHRHQDNQGSVAILNNASNRFEVNEKCDVFNVIPVHNYSSSENTGGSQQSTQVPRVSTAAAAAVASTTVSSASTTTTIQCINSHGTITNFAAINYSSSKSNENSWICELQNRSSDQEQKEHETKQDSTTNTPITTDSAGEVSSASAAAAAAATTALIYQNIDEASRDSSDESKPQQSQSPRTEPHRPSYTSTEAQTDFDLMTEPSQIAPPQLQPQSSDESRQRRRRERRERRNQRRFLNNFNIDPSLYDYRLLPDLLNINAAPPPYYSTLPLHQPPPPPPNGTVGPTTAPNAFLMSTSGPSQTSAPIPMPIPVHLPSSAAAAAINTPTPQATAAGAAAAVVVPNTIVPFHLPGEIHHQLLQNSSNGHLVQHPASAAAAAAAAAATTFRFQFPPNIQFQRARFGSRFSTEENQKSCCGLVLNKPSSIRYFIALIALTAVFCVLVGTILGVMRPAGRDHLTVSLLMIGVGVIMITVCGITWKLTSQSSACNSLFGLGPSTHSNEPSNRRFTNRLPPSYGRPHHPYAAMVYPEFMCRPPPPSYQASMQEYRLRLLLLERGCTNNAFFQPNLFNSQQINNGNNSNHNNNNNATPPPTYRSHNNSLLRNAISHTRGNSLQTNCSDIIIHSHHDRDNNTLNNTSAMVNVVNILSNQDEYCNSYKTAAASENNHLVVDKINPLKLYLSSSANLNEIVLNQSDNDNETKENAANTTTAAVAAAAVTTTTTTTTITTTSSETVVAVPTHPNANNTNNLVTIVQTNDRNPVIVTVSGPTEAIPTNFSSDFDDDNDNDVDVDVDEDDDENENDEHPSNVLHVSNDMQILAHL